MPRTRPRVVYWDNIPAPYAVERYNILANRGTFDFSVWFSRRTDTGRSWDIDESAWGFNGAYVEDPSTSLQAAHEFARRCDAARPDLILALYGERSFAAGHLVLKGLGLKTALLVLPTYDAWVRRAWWKEIGKHVLFRSADAAKVPGPDGLAYARRYGFTDDRVFAVRQSITVDRYADPISCQQRLRIRDGLGLDGCAFLCVGRLWHGKGLSVLLDAFQRVTQANRVVSLLLVGDGPDEAALRTAAAGINGVHFHQFVQAPELPPYYGACDVFVFPTLGDPHGQVVEEAHAAGLPIITSDAAGDIRRRVADGVNGFVVPAGDVNALANRMITLAADAGLRRAMGARGAERAKAWDNAAWADDFERFVSGALALPRRATAAARAAAAAGTIVLTTADLAARTGVWRKKAAHVRANAEAMNAPEARYAEKMPLAFRCACAWMKYAPRAKSWVPRRIGRSIGRGMTCAIRTRAGALLAVDPVNLDFYCQVQLQNGVWEQDVLHACLRVTQPGDVFFDIGANAGIVTVDVARTFGESVTIHAFEPQPTLARTLAVSIGLNEFTRVRLHRLLLGDAPGEADLYVADHAIHSSLVSREAGATRLTCRMETIDRLVADGSLPPPTVIKIDVEGAELRVVHGARNTFRAKPPVIVFEADNNMARFGYTHRDLFGLLREFTDYSFHRINGAAWIPVNSLDDAALGDYVALPPSWRRS